jgi:hypothetical protein
MGMKRAWGVVAAVVLVVGAGVATASPAAAKPLLPGNPTPLTDVVGQLIAIGTGGSQRVCATSGLGYPVRCVEGVAVLPAGSADAYAVTYGHWVFCRGGCGSVLGHELVHVAQFEHYGDQFGPQYLLEAAVNGTGCENQYEKPAYGPTRCP